MAGRQASAHSCSTESRSWSKQGFESQLFLVALHPSPPIHLYACSRPGTPVIESIKALVSLDLELVVIAPDDGGLCEHAVEGWAAWGRDERGNAACCDSPTELHYCGCH